MTEYPSRDISIYYVPEFLSLGSAPYFLGWHHGDDFIIVLQKNDAETRDLTHLGLPPLQVIGVLAGNEQESTTRNTGNVLAIERVENQLRIKLVSSHPPARNAHYIAVHEGLIAGRSFIRHQNVSLVYNQQHLSKYTLINAIPFLRSCYIQSFMPRKNQEHCRCARERRVDSTVEDDTMTALARFSTYLSNISSFLTTGLATMFRWSQTQKLLYRKARLFKEWFALLDTLHKYRECLHCAPKYGCCYHPLERKVAVVTTLRSITVHLVLDLLLGSLVAILVTWIPNTIDEYILRWVDWIFSVIRVDKLYSYVDWLMGSPVGMKMNLFLNRVFGLTCLFVLDMYLLVSTWLRTWISPQSFVYTIAIIGCASVTFLFATAIDSFTIATLHIRLISKVFSAIYSIVFSILVDIWRLLRGYKSNPLRNRIDTLKILLYAYSYDKERTGEQWEEKQTTSEDAKGDDRQGTAISHDESQAQYTESERAEAKVNTRYIPHGRQKRISHPRASLSMGDEPGNLRSRQFEDPSLLEEKLQTKNQLDTQRMIIASVMGVVLAFILPTLFSWHFVFGVAFNGVLVVLALLHLLEEVTKSAPVRLFVQRETASETFRSEVYYDYADSHTQRTPHQVRHTYEDIGDTTEPNVTSVQTHTWFVLRTKTLPLNRLLSPTLKRAVAQASAVFPFTSIGSTIRYVVTGKLPQEKKDFWKSMIDY